MVCMQFTWFKCGGLSVGLSWSHVLGDAFPAFNFITKWSQIRAVHTPPKTLHIPLHKQTEYSHIKSVNAKPISIKMATTEGKLWLATNDTKMVTHTFNVTPKQLDHLVRTIFPCNQNKTARISYFEILSALVWKHIARIRGATEPKVVTIFTHDIGPNKFPTNDLVINVVEANVVVGKSDVADLARLIGEEKRIENGDVENLVEEIQGKGDFVVYGAKLTFVDLEKSNMYEVVLNGQKPIIANCSIHGVGDQGVVLVLPGLEDGRMVTVSLPEKEVEQLEEKLRGEWGIESLAF